MILYDASRRRRKTVESIGLKEIIVSICSFGILRVRPDKRQGKKGLSTRSFEAR